MAIPTLLTWGRGSHINERNNTKRDAMVQKNKRMNSNRHKRNLPTGIYVMEARTSEQTISRQFVKQ
jgi:hypothetical protein